MKNSYSIKKSKKRRLFSTYSANVAFTSNNISGKGLPFFGA